MRIGDLFIDESDIVESFVRASGPGGQNVNKVSTAVELRFDARRALPPYVAEKAIRLAGQRATLEGVIIIFAQRFSSQPRNREDARARLAAILLKAQERQAPRRPTKPTFGSKLRRLDAKSRRGEIKSLRGRADEGE